jgi:hydrogenase maturation protein HypF
LPDLTAPPFRFPKRYFAALKLIHKEVRTFATTSMGRLFDTAAALLGFTREVSFEGQAAMWLEQLAWRGTLAQAYPFPFTGEELDFRPLLQSIADDRMAGRDAHDVARSFQMGIAQGLSDCVRALCRKHSIDTVVLSGGVFQNQLLLKDLHSLLAPEAIQVWSNCAVPANDGGISLGQAALAALSTSQGKVV